MKEKILRGIKKWLMLCTAVCIVMLCTGCVVSDRAQEEMISEALSEAASQSAKQYAERQSREAERQSQETLQEESKSQPVTSQSAQGAEILDENGSYTSCEDVALYLETYDRLPNNFITKQEARQLGWEGGSLEPYAPGKCIGGDKFGNYEGLLPGKKGRTYRECDIDTLGADSRGAKRIVYSDDGLIYYTEDHYASFTLLYD